MKKVKHTVSWLVHNASQVALAVMAIRDGSEGAMRLLMVLTWLGLMLVIIGLAFSDKPEYRKRIKNDAKNRLIPVGLSLVVDVAVGCSLIWFGAIFTGLASMISGAISKAIVDEIVNEDVAAKDLHQGDAASMPEASLN